uniref:Endonuclease/exonuclease/phosphatase domain-containing protein n=1 Tax=Chenopodium quinoa TaxID=63459 RepID=A0A803MGT1_CHEQI
MRAIREEFMSLLPNAPLHVFDSYPIFPMVNMSIKILIWNVQGVGNKLTIIRELVRIHKPSMLVLVETHISGENSQQVCYKINFSGKTRVDAQGFAGGIWLFWREEEVSVTTFDSNTQHLTVEIRRVGDDPWLFSAIYASPDSNLRRQLWSELERIKDQFTGPWLIAGDFNETRSVNERNGVSNLEKMQGIFKLGRE